MPCSGLLRIGLCQGQAPESKGEGKACVIGANTWASAR